MTGRAARKLWLFPGSLCHLWGTSNPTTQHSVLSGVLLEFSGIYGHDRTTEPVVWYSDIFSFKRLIYFGETVLRDGECLPCCTAFHFEKLSQELRGYDRRKAPKDEEAEVLPDGSYNDDDRYRVLDIVT